ncbi:MAG TPA: Ig-like domain repeat protein, partial [Acidobacteriaceae bacterium]|nr:Ig-like domain repeat protein [Acidobacteriaceae bacterium]
GQFTSSTIFGGVGGTSTSAPAFAGMLALIEQKTGGRLGQADTVLYQLASSKCNAVFHDVTVGNNSVPCVSGSPNCGSNSFLTGYDAGTGYDLATGLGSVDVKALIANWGSAALASTSTSLQLNGSSAAYSGTHGANVTFNVGVNPTAATGSVAILDTANETATGPQNNGQFTIPLNSGSGTATYNGLPGGTYTVSARYAGDASDAASASSPISVTISPEPSTTVLQVNAYSTLTGAAVSGSSIPYGSALFTDARVEGTAEGSGTQGLATGTVTFTNNGSTLGSAAIGSDNIASWPALNAKPFLLSPGSYSFQASYPGDPSYNSSTGAVVPVTIVKAATTVAANNPPAKVFGIYGNSGSVPLSFWIQTPYTLGAAPTGSITVTANGQSAQTVTDLSAVTAGSGASRTWLMTAYCPIPDSLFTSGSNTIAATYSGDANYATSSQTITVTDTDGIGSFAMTGSGDLSAVAGQQVQEQLSFTPVGGFYDFVYVTFSGIPAGVTTGSNGGFGYFNGTQATALLTGSPVVGNVSFSTAYNLAAGTYPITATAKDPTGKVVQTVTFNLIISAIPANAGITVANGGAVTFPAGATNLNTASITVTPTNGFIGYLSIACSVSNSSSSVSNPACNLTYPFVALNSTSSQPVSIPFTSSGAAPGTYTVTVTVTDVYNSSITAATSFPLTITAPPDVSLSGGAAITMYPNASTTATITITPQNGFTGTVPLSCWVKSSPAGPGANGGLNCQIPPSVAITGSNPVTAALTINTISAATLGSYQVEVDATATSPSESLSTSLIVPVTVQASPAISITNSGNITVARGATTGNTSTITVTPSNGFTGAVNLSCAITNSPAGGSDPPTCSIPSSVSITGTTAATATLSVATTAPSAALLDRPLTRFLFGEGGAVLALLVFFGIPARRRAWRTLSMLAVVVLTAAVIGCSGGGGSGGSGSGGGQTNPGTTPGIYTITVTGKDAATGAITASSNVTLNVN